MNHHLLIAVAGALLLLCCSKADGRPLAPIVSTPPPRSTSLNIRPLDHRSLIPYPRPLSPMATMPPPLWKTIDGGSAGATPLHHLQLRDQDDSGACNAEDLATKVFDNCYAEGSSPLLGCCEVVSTIFHKGTRCICHVSLLVISRGYSTERLVEIHEQCGGEEIGNLTSLSCDGTSAGNLLPAPGAPAPPTPQVPSMTITYNYGNMKLEITATTLSSIIILVVLIVLVALVVRCVRERRRKSKDCRRRKKKMKKEARRKEEEARRKEEEVESRKREEARKSALVEFIADLMAGRPVPEILEEEHELILMRYLERERERKRKGKAAGDLQDAVAGAIQNEEDD